MSFLFVFFLPLCLKINNQPRTKSINPCHLYHDNNSSTWNGNDPPTSQLISRDVAVTSFEFIQINLTMSHVKSWFYMILQFLLVKSLFSWRTSRSVCILCILVALWKAVPSRPRPRVHPQWLEGAPGAAKNKSTGPVLPNVLHLGVSRAFPSGKQVIWPRDFLDTFPWFALMVDSLTSYAGPK